MRNQIIYCPECGTKGHYKEITETKINWIGFIGILIWASVFAFFGIYLPKLINEINGSNLYGHWASYVIMMLMFWIFVSDVPLILPKEKENKK